MAYYVVMPEAFKYLLSFQGQKGGLDIEALPAAGDYLGLVMQFILAFGISFLLPVLLLLLNRAGIVSRKKLIGLRRYVIVILTGFAAIITPPTAEASATAEPETPPNKVQATIFTCPSPPRICPTSAAAKATRWSAILPRIIRSPAKMKNGMASMENTFMPEESCCTTTMAGRSR